MDPHYHLIGIGGIGMSALAHLLLQSGKKVSGSDHSPSFLIQTLEKEGAHVFFGHAACHVPKEATVVYSTDIKSENPEMRQAIDLGLKRLHRSELLAELMSEKHSLLVAGTHGKTTTSSLLTHLLVNAGLDPSFAVGGIIKSLDTNGRSGKGDYFVAEADESDGSFLKYLPFGAIVTNIGQDHLDHWETFDALISGFSKFAHSTQSAHHLLWCGDDPVLSSLGLPGNSYGFHEKNTLYIHDYQQRGWKCVFSLKFRGAQFSDIEIPLVGKHNVLNAAAVFGLAFQLNIPEETIRESFLSFQGAARRAELKAEISNILIFDDYGHHPTEIAATVRAIKAAIGNRQLVVAFQPHRYTRTKDCMDLFGSSLVEADRVVLTDIYSAGEKPIENVTTEALFLKMKNAIKKEINYVSRGDLSAFLSQTLQPEDVLLTMGAGDITKVGPEVVSILKNFRRVE